MSHLGKVTPATYNTAPVPGYRVGAGRGAVGFTTRSDIGPAETPVAPAGYVAGAGRGATGMGDAGSSALMGGVVGGGIQGTF
jgi:hypothetical protein